MANEGLEHVRDLIRQFGIRTMRLEMSDTHGIARSKLVPAEQLSAYWDSGLNMYGGTLGLDVQSDVVPGTGYGEEIQYGDHFLVPDASTFRVVPWLPNTARLICDPQFAEDRPCMASPRLVLRKILDGLDSLGYEAFMGYEPEFYVLDPETLEPVFSGKHIFTNLRNAASPLVQKLFSSLGDMGIPVRTINCEYAPGQIEVSHSPETGMDGADLGYTIKNSIKEIAQQEGVLATFMTKPFTGISACGCHYHFSLRRKDNGKNAFYDESKENGLSDACLHAIGGQLAHCQAITALLAPTVNCYKRFRAHTFAPMNVTWGLEDRTAAIRIKAGREESTHIENRAGCGSANPYLLAVGCLGAAYLGISNKSEPPPPVTELADSLETEPPLPTGLGQSLTALEQDSAMTNLLGDEFVKLFVAVKRYEIQKHLDTVTDFERSEFIEFL